MNITLPKWPGMIVEGDPVTPELAAEIIIRTDSQLPDFNYAGNDPELCHQLNDIFSVPYVAVDTDKLWKLRDKLHMVSVGYLCNSRIISSWIGGPHGWVNWDGVVGSRNYNIGKWPNVDRVLKEWQDIAAAFPSLKLTCWLHNKETCEPDNTAIVQFDIASGTATAHIPDREPKDSGFTEPDYGSWLVLSRESGIGVDDLKTHLKRIYGRIPKYSTRKTKKAII